MAKFCRCRSVRLGKCGFFYVEQIKLCLRSGIVIEIDDLRMTSSFFNTQYSWVLLRFFCQLSKRSSLKFVYRRWRWCSGLWLWFLTGTVMIRVLGESLSFLFLFALVSVFIISIQISSISILNITSHMYIRYIRNETTNLGGIGFRSDWFQTTNTSLRKDVLLTTTPQKIGFTVFYHK